MVNKTILSIGNFAISNLIINGVNKGTYFDGIGFRFALICSYYKTKCHYITALGKDREWQQVINNFMKNNCIPASIYRSNRSVSFYWNYQNDQLKLTSKNLDVMQEIVSLLKPEHFKDIDLFNLCALGYINEEKAVHEANKQKCPISYIFHRSNFTYAKPDDYLKLIDKVDLFFLNEEEANILTGENNVDSAGKRLKQFCPNVFITRGAKGVSWFGDYKQVDYPAIKTNVVDTSGAGDIFASSVINGYNFGLDINQSIRMGIVMASISVSGYFTDCIYNTIC